jgi:hypothetical protein
MKPFSDLGKKVNKNNRRVLPSCRRSHQTSKENTVNSLSNYYTSFSILAAKLALVDRDLILIRIRIRIHNTGLKLRLFLLYICLGTRDNSDSSNYTGAGTDGDEAHDLKRKEFYEVQYCLYIFMYSTCIFRNRKALKTQRTHITVETKNK